MSRPSLDSLNHWQDFGDDDFDDNEDHDNTADDSNNNKDREPQQDTNPKITIQRPDEDEDEEMGVRESFGENADIRVGQPLLGDERGRNALNDDINYNTRNGSNVVKRRKMRSVSPFATSTNKSRYILAAIALIISLVAFVVQTEIVIYIQHTLHWNKSYCMLYLSHSSWFILWPVQLLVLRVRKRSQPWRTFLQSHISLLKSTVAMIQPSNRGQQRSNSEVVYFSVITISQLTAALTVAASTWYLAVNLTTASDLTAIYNCGAFFAYAFSIPILKEKPRLDKVVSVVVAIVGVFIVAYGDGNTDPNTPENIDRPYRIWGNIIIGIGSVLYGLYEVMYKKLACPPDGTSSGRSLIFANTVAASIGLFTMLVLWIPIPILHITGVELFELPRGQTAWLLFISVIMNAIFSGSFLGLVSLTSPVLGAVSSLISIFLVAFTDWAVFGTRIAPAALFGGLIIIAAFSLLSWATWKEMSQDREKRRLAREGDEDDGGDDDDEEDYENGEQIINGENAAAGRRV